jgi:aryl carrier-like protein
MSINFEKMARSKNQERRHINEGIADFSHPDYLDDFYEETIGIGKSPEMAINPVSYYDDGNRFDVTQEIKNVKKMPPGHEKDAAFLELKQHFLEQQKGLAILKDEIFQEIGDGARIEKEKIHEIIRENDKKYKFSEEQMVIIKGMISEFFKRNQIVNHFYKNHSDNPKRLFQKFYRVAPEGDIKLHRGPASLSLICDNQNDYSRIFANDSSGKRPLDETKKIASLSGGVFLSSHPRDFPELQYAIIGINKLEYYNTNIVNTIITHEEQHALNRIYSHHVQPLIKKDLSSALYFCDDRKQMHTIISSYCRYLIWQASERAKDEILAYKSTNNPDEDIVKFLTSKKDDDGLYDYFDFNKTMEEIKYIVQGVNYDNNEEHISHTLPQQQEELIESAKTILEEDYKNLIKNGLSAINILRNKNHSQEAITAILMPQALENWPKIADRAVFFNITDENGISSELKKPRNAIRNIISDEDREKLRNLQNKIQESEDQ